MPTALALIDDRIAVTSLRKPSHGLYASTVPSDRTSPKQLLKLVALSVTLVRIPIILFGIVALTSGWMWLACLSFTMFALLDYFDGVAARRTGQDTALRRIGDVLLDRVSIHVVILLTCLHYNKGWVVWSLLLARDLTQGAFSSCLLAKYRVLIIGAYWHMSYGVAILIWECTFLTSGVVSGSLSACIVGIVAATGADYMRRCLRLVAQ